jgi:hypothetical protein
MSIALKKPDQASGGTAHRDDLYAWVTEQVAHLRAGRLSEIDAENIAEELGDVGNELYFRLESAVAIVILHLLKWDHQPERRSRSWTLSIAEHRDRVIRLLRRNPGLKAEIGEALEAAWRTGRRRALDETGLPDEAFPEDCPDTFAVVMERPVVYDPAVHRLRG